MWDILPVDICACMHIRHHSKGAWLDPEVGPEARQDAKVLHMVLHRRGLQACILQAPTRLHTACKRPRLCAHHTSTHLHDDLAVGNHHGDPSEQGLQVFRQLLAPSIARVHGDEVADSGIQSHRGAVCEDEGLAALPDGTQHAVHLQEHVP